MELEIKKLTPDLVEQYLHFFDVTLTILIAMKINAIVHIGVVLIPVGKIFLMPYPDVISLSNMFKKDIFKVI